MPPTTVECLRERLTNRREEFGITVGRLARWSGLDAELISQFEKKERGLTSSEYERLCWGLAVDPSALYAGLDTNPQRTLARFRSQDALPSQDAEDIRLLALAAELGRTLGALLTQVHNRQPKLNNYRRVTPLVDDLPPWKDGYELGARTRETLNIPPGPILDLEGLLLSLDVHIARVAFNAEGIEAASIWEPGAVPIIMLNKRAPRVRDVLSRRAVLGHELCHLLFDASQQGDLAARLSWGQESRLDDRLEQRARAFSPVFIAPFAQVYNLTSIPNARNLTEAQTHVVRLGRMWGLSGEGATWHAKNLELIKLKQCRTLLRNNIRISLKKGQRFENSAYTSPTKGTSQMVHGWGERLIREALQKDIVSDGRAKELLAWH